MTNLYLLMVRLSMRVALYFVRKLPAEKLVPLAFVSMPRVIFDDATEGYDHLL